MNRGDPRTALFRIDVIEIPVLTRHGLSRIVSSLLCLQTTKAAKLAGLWRGGDHGDETQDLGRQMNVMTLPYSQQPTLPQEHAPATVSCSISRTLSILLE